MSSLSLWCFEQLGPEGLVLEKEDTQKDIFL